MTTLAVGQATAQAFPPENVQFHGSLNQTAITNRTGTVGGFRTNVCNVGTINGVAAGVLNMNYNSSNVIFQTNNYPVTEFFIYGPGMSYNTLSLYNSSENTYMGYVVTGASISYSAPIVAISFTYTYTGADGGPCSETLGGYFRTEQ